MRALAVPPFLPDAPVFTESAYRSSLSEYRLLRTERGSARVLRRSKTSRNWLDLLPLLVNRSRQLRLTCHDPPLPLGRQGLEINRPNNVAHRRLGRRLNRVHVLSAQKRSVKTVPSPSVERTERLPPCSRMIWRDRLRPMPEPSSLVVKKGTKIFSCTSSGMPGPLSST